MEEDKSKSQLKREMKNLQKMGEKLAGLTESQLSKIEMPEELRSAVITVRSMKKHEAVRRQMQYIGALMRKTDIEPVRAALEEIEAGMYQEARAFHQLESWRDALIGGDDGLVTEIEGRFSGIDRQHFRQLIRNARKEKTGAVKAKRALFRYLKGLQEDGL